ncbi:TPA: UDP-N-acetylmuramate--L-alanine ligase [Candidatus Dependentiae bacterium]|nr:MAG: UDP-N-acetylmuramate-L-alanine ligase [candidate division TM6 bacterium GW2011_GWF2_43_87]HBL98480.1 UDP-N-acetylmuramate--L-alanine ligase [Candidatus Dependentiae bacterium]
MYKKKRHIHFVGIGGIGMSSIAAILKQQGYQISGCDSDLGQKSVKNLLALGCDVSLGNNSASCIDLSIDILVHSTAIKMDSPELVRARERGIPVVHRADMLAELTKKKYSIAVSGSHGKTTTTSLIAHLLIEGRIDPTIIVGGIMHNLGSNARYGAGDFLVAEADESDRSFTTLFPSIAVITNIDLEHLDVYRDAADLKKTFLQFLERLPWYGKVFLCSDDKLARELLLEMPESIRRKTITYGFEAGAAVQAMNSCLESEYSSCDVLFGNKVMHLRTQLLGRHNLLNSIVAAAVAVECGVGFDVVESALQVFRGVDQRFTHRGVYRGAAVFDDYGHHPTEIDNMLTVALRRIKAQNKGRLIVVFQPHRFSRTEKLWEAFISVFSNGKVDHLIITDIHPASESPIAGITGERLVCDLVERGGMKNAYYVSAGGNYEDIVKKLDVLLQENDLLLFLGAGKINRLAEKLCTN